MSITVTRTSAAQYRATLPVVGGSATQFVRWHLKTNPAGTWSLQGCYGIDTSSTPQTEVQLSDIGDNSVYEYAWPVGVSGATSIGFDYFGNGHGHETLLTATLLLDGVSVTTLADGASTIGTSFVVYQTTNTRLPKNANGTVNDVTVCGSGTLRHTFTATGLLVEHTHTITAGYVVYANYAAMCPTSAENLDRIQIGTSAVYEPFVPVVDVTVGFGTQAATFSAWSSNPSVNPYRVTCTLPSGGPDSTGLWTTAGPDYTNFVDNATRGKWYVFLVGSQIASAINTGTTSHSQTYAVSLVDTLVFDQDVFDTDVFMQDTASDIAGSDAPVTVATTSDELVTA